MFSRLRALFAALFGEGIARMLSGAGLALTTGMVLTPMMTGGLQAAASAIGGVPADILNVALLGGLGSVMSIVGTAMVTRIAVSSATIGLKKATQQSNGPTLPPL